MLHDHRAIDPMALILSGEAYLKWVEMHHPNEPALTKVGDAVKTLSASDKKFALAKAGAMVAYGRAATEALQGVHK
jgi:hypothetical protein